MSQQTSKLFSYGTLQQESVQLVTFGRVLEGEADRLIGYRITLVPIADDKVIGEIGSTTHRNIEFTGTDSDFVAGTVFAVTSDELKQADAYEEPAAYERIQIQLESDGNVWVYLRPHR